MNRYRDIDLFYNTNLKRNYRTNFMYPFIPPSEDDTYLISSDGDRYDLLADVFYNDPKLWWIIASANNATVDDLAIQPGLQIRVPGDKNKALVEYLSYNENR